MNGTTETKKQYRNYIAGKWVQNGSGGILVNTSPADRRDIVGEFQQGDVNEVNEAVAAAKEAFRKWGLVPAPVRAEIVRKTGDLLVKHKEEIARTMTRDLGILAAQFQRHTLE